MNIRHIYKRFLLKKFFKKNMYNTVSKHKHKINIKFSTKNYNNFKKILFVTITLFTFIFLFLFIFLLYVNKNVLTNDEIEYSFSLLSNLNVYFIENILCYLVI